MRTWSKESELCPHTHHVHIFLAMVFIVGEFDYIEGWDSNGVLVRAFTPTSKNEFALDVS